MSEASTLVKPSDVATKRKEPAKTDILNANDRCDRCTAAAFVRVPMKISEANPEGMHLQFCSHHYNKVELNLLEYIDGTVLDERWKLVYDRHTGTENS